MSDSKTLTEGTKTCPQCKRDALSFWTPAPNVRKWRCLSCHAGGLAVPAEGAGVKVVEVKEAPKTDRGCDVCGGRPPKIREPYPGYADRWYGDEDHPLCSRECAQAFFVGDRIQTLTCVVSDDFADPLHKTIEKLTDLLAAWSEDRR